MTIEAATVAGPKRGANAALPRERESPSVPATRSSPIPPQPITAASPRAGVDAELASPPHNHPRSLA